MEFLILQTSAGPISFVGRLHTSGPRRPALLAVGGSFPPKGALHELVTAFPGANVLIANLPGMVGTPWANPTPAELAKGLEEATTLLLRDLPIVALGVSTGNLITLGLTLPNIVRRVLVEPFFQTQDLWPFVANSHERMALNPNNPKMARFFWDYFGIGPDSLENRDYRHLMDAITVPSDVLVGGLPLLPRRATAIWPSFTSAEDREALSANPWIRMMVGPPDSGHSFGVFPPSDEDLKRVVHAALLDVARELAP